MSYVDTVTGRMVWYGTYVVVLRQHSDKGYSIVWYMVWYGVVWCGHIDLYVMIWYGLVLCGLGHTDGWGELEGVV